MDLRAKVLYHSSVGSLSPGDTTEGRPYSEAKKQQMLTDFPDWFEVISGGKVTASAPETTQEDGVRKPRGK